MSLKLRKECEGILTTAGYGNYHVSIDIHKKLAIVTECGSTLLAIGGIRFTNFSPTGKEIEYAGELLGAYLIKHKDAIDAYLTAKKAVPEPVNVRELCPHITRSGNINNIVYAQGDARIHIVNRTDVVQIDSHKNECLVDFVIDREILAEVLAALATQKEYSTRTEEVNDLRVALNKCEI